MNIFCNSEGVIFHVTPERIFQGSAGSNKIYFIGQFPSSAQVLMQYELPNGVKTSPKPMAHLSDIKEFETESGGKFSVWEATIGASPKVKNGAVVKDNNGNIVYDLDYTITENYGKATIQFYVHLAQKEVLATGITTFDIEKGVPMELPYSLSEEGDVTKLLATFLDVVENTQQLYGNVDENISSLRTWVTMINTDYQAIDAAISETANKALETANKAQADVDEVKQDVFDLELQFGGISALGAIVDELVDKVAYAKASSISVSVDPNTYVATFTLHADGGLPISKATIDLPTEELVVSGAYDEGSQSIILTTKDGKQIRVPVQDLVRGLVSLDENGKIPMQYLPEGIGSGGGATEDDVKNALTNSTEEWTDTEKASACETIGAVPQTKINADMYVVYGRASSYGNYAPQEYTFSYTPSHGSFVRWGDPNTLGATETTPYGALYAPTPKQPFQAANKKYVDDLIASLQAQINALK